MLAVSVQPPPLRCTVKTVPGGPDAGEIGRAEGVTVKAVSASLFSPDLASIRCGPPRSSNALKGNWKLPEASGVTVPSLVEDSSQPEPLTRLPTTLNQRRSIGWFAGKLR